MSVISGFVVSVGAMSYTSINHSEGKREQPTQTARSRKQRRPCLHSSPTRSSTARLSSRVLRTMSHQRTSISISSELKATTRTTSPVAGGLGQVTKLPHAHQPLPMPQLDSVPRPETSGAPQRQT